MHISYIGRFVIRDKLVDLLDGRFWIEYGS